MGAIIRSVGTYFPKDTIGNTDLEKILAFSGQSTNDEWILTRTGISKRRIANNDETVGVLAYRAACDALDSLKEDIPPIEHIVFATNTSERFFPNAASETQALLRSSHGDRIRATAGFSDVGTGCAGINCAIKYGDALVSSGIHKTVLVIGADKLSSVTNYADRNTCILFEDGASADIFSGISPVAGFRGHYEQGDGSVRELISCNIKEKMTAEEALRLLRGGTVPKFQMGRVLEMDGRAVFRYVGEQWDDLFKGNVDKDIPALEENRALNPDGISYEGIGWVSAHRANFRCLEAKDKKYPGFLEKCGLDKGHEDFCNSSTASQGTRRKEFVTQARPGEYLLSFGYGAGSYACANLYKKP